MRLIITINQALNGSTARVYGPNAEEKIKESTAPPDKTRIAGIRENAAISKDAKNESHPTMVGLKNGTISRATISPVRGKINSKIWFNLRREGLYFKAATN